MTKGENAMVKELKLYEKLEKALEKVPEDRPSYFQLKHFVLGKQPTIQGQLWQCLRELQTRKEVVDSIQLEIEETKDHLELIDMDEADHNHADKKFKIIRRQLERKRVTLRKSIDKLEKKLKFTNEEIQFILQYYEALLKVEPLKEYDDLEVQKEYWNEKYSQEINLRILLKQPINTELTKEIIALPDDVPIKIEFLNFLDKVKNSGAQLKVEQEANVKRLLQNITEKLLEGNANV